MTTGDDRDDIIVVDYDPRWPGQFETERAAIVEALGELCAGIEHIGSTAVPGLAAKPVIDVMIGVRDLSLGERAVGPMESLGYEFRGDGGMPEHLLFRRGMPRTHHIHMVERDGSYWVEHLAFRDLLRARPEVAREYAALKRELAVRYRQDRVAYTDAKGEFVTNALAAGR